MPTILVPQSRHAGGREGVSVVVYIDGAEDEAAWAAAVDRLIAEGVIDGPEQARGMTRVELLGADLAEVREDDAARAEADLVIRLRG
jgi:hypothetical protein